MGEAGCWEACLLQMAAALSQPQLMQVAGFLQTAQLSISWLLSQHQCHGLRPLDKLMLGQHQLVQGQGRASKRDLWQQRRHVNSAP